MDFTRHDQKARLGLLVFILLSATRTAECFNVVAPSSLAGRSAPRGCQKNDALFSISSSDTTTTTMTTPTGLSSRTLSSSSSSPPACYLANYTTVVEFPCYDDLLQLKPGECVVSDVISVTSTQNDETFDFCVKLYPRGGGHNSQYSIFSTTTSKNKQPKGGFGMSYKAVIPFFGGGGGGSSKAQDEKVGVYLQFLPRNSSNAITRQQQRQQQQHEIVDATFGLRLRGKQQQPQQPRFDVEWRAGMRFVPLQRTKLASGQANDFGAHLMQTQMLADFLGISKNDKDDDNRNNNNNKNPVELQVDILIHDLPEPSSENEEALQKAQEDATNESAFSSGFGLAPLIDIRVMPNADGSTFSDVHNPEQVRVGRIVVPILRRLSERPYMFAQGTYPGVEYRILRIIDPETQQDLFYSRPGVDYELKPIYPLVPQLERSWPVRVNEKNIPKLYTPNMYNAVSAVGSLLTAVTGLLTAFVISQAVSIFVIPSRSMDPTLQVGDVLLVDKVTPRLFRQLHAGNQQQTGQVVLFRPPQPLRDIVARSGGRLTERDLFVKRIAAVAGSTFSVDRAGNIQIDGANPVERRDLCTAEPLRLIEKYIRPVDDQFVEPGQVVVLGDCSSVSVDSRVWGPLPSDNIVGRPILRVWPLSRFGPVQPLTTEWED